MIEKYLEKRKNKLFFYSPYTFLREIDNDIIFLDTIKNPLIRDLENNGIDLIEINVDKSIFIFLVKKLEWESDFFGYSIYKLVYVLYDTNDFSFIVKAIEKFNVKFCKNVKYIYADIPSEDNILLQALNRNRFTIIETRLNYYIQPKVINKQLINYTRSANKLDIENLKKTAVKMRNEFDRVHSEIFFTPGIADKYIEKFIENAVNGFADITLVPNDKDIPNAFLSANKPIEYMGINIAKLVLAAVDIETRKGWLNKLLSNMLLLQTEFHTDYLTTITQSANRAAFNVWQKSGFKLFSTTHILSKYD